MTVKCLFSLLLYLFVTIRLFVLRTNNFENKVSDHDETFEQIMTIGLTG